MNEWINVKDRLPEENKLYLCVRTSHPKMWLESFDTKERKFGVWWDYEPDGQYHKKYRFIENKGISHWMPLPEPPKGE